MLVRGSRVGIIGGSIAGCAIGIAPERLGCEPVEPTPNWHSMPTNTFEAWTKRKPSGERLYRYGNPTFTDASWHAEPRLNERYGARNLWSTAIPRHGLPCSWQPPCHP